MGGLLPPLNPACSQALVLAFALPLLPVLWLQQMKRWPTWSCGVSVFPWSYTDAETCYVLEGRVLVTPDGESAMPWHLGVMNT